MEKINVGFRIYKNIKRASRELQEYFKDIPPSNIGDTMNRLYCMHEYIRSINNKKMLGTAFTVKTPIGDNLMIHRALDLAQPGDILVIDGGSAMNRSLMGEIMFTYAQVRGLAGIVIDGCIRDVDSTSKLCIPIYAKGVTPQGPFKFGPGEINVPIACGGQVVFPGDILVGDQDGIVVIHQDDAQYIAENARKKVDGEAIKLEKYRAGNLDINEHTEMYEKLVRESGGMYID
jgi:RraA family protein